MRPAFLFVWRNVLLLDESGYIESDECCDENKNAKICEKIYVNLFSKLRAKLSFVLVFDIRF